MTDLTVKELCHQTWVHICIVQKVSCVRPWAVRIAKHAISQIACERYHRTRYKSIKLADLKTMSIVPQTRVTKMSQVDTEKEGWISTTTE